MLSIKAPLKISDFKEVLFENQNLEISDEILQKADRSFQFLQEFAKDKVIYGVNTGFGPMAQYRIKDEDRLQLQYNLIRSHASGTGKPIDPLYIKASMLARLNTLSLGYSGVNISVLETMQQLINHDITPLIFEHGGVGASGDLVQLAHLALVLIGEGEVFYKGERKSTKSVFKELNIKPIEIKLREGLALINGTSVMTGIGIVNLIHARRLLEWSVCCSSMLNELVSAYSDHFSSELNASKLHESQHSIAEMMRDHLKDSQRIKNRQDHLYRDSSNSESIFSEKVQEYYSLRCIPQILGPVLDTINSAEKILMDEVNSANDNPIVSVEKQMVYHGGNFHGDFISLEMDKLKLVITRLSMLAERQLNYILNSKLNEIFPPFVNLGKLGLNFGLQGAQFSAVSTTAENQTLSNSMYVHSIPNNNDNQDIVSMGTNSANITKTVIDNAYQVLAVEMMAIVQGIKYIGDLDSFSEKTKAVFKQFQHKIELDDQHDFPLYETIEDFTKSLKENEIYK
ncbi:aromatic amino acid lyase [Zunongwangia sp. SCSIO 43204]|uniref:HAL/PAL/TAL family ammonia-lyase n=1 Tax=Zunongwangia sp. SCSIO 43204 TaxID=2779359 RepID=UPI001CA8A57C|nr:aromatic amino acid ammonia-lyase [Zunongwangia sp. SCSIO 43204]UAB83500.1 aromatic amino acid lyase [Zunongwangia sp. SCSIO 43204]